MNLEEFIGALETAAQKYAQEVQILAETQNSVKARLDITESIAVQCYYNQKSANDQCCPDWMVPSVILEGFGGWYLAPPPF